MPSRHHLIAPSPATQPRNRQALTAEFRRHRTRLAALPAHIRAYVRVAWSRHGGSRSPEHLGDIIDHACAALGACPCDFPSLSAAERRERTRQLNLSALSAADNPDVVFQYSAGVLAWLADGPAHASTVEPLHNFRTALRARLALLRQALSRCTTFHSPDASSGVTQVGAASFQFQIRCLQISCDQVSRVPWSADFTRRIVQTRMADEPPFPPATKTQ
jgi:hypothetical protein